MNKKIVEIYRVIVFCTIENGEKVKEFLEVKKPKIYNYTKKEKPYCLEIVTNAYGERILLKKFGNKKNKDKYEICSYKIPQRKTTKEKTANFIQQKRLTLLE